ncbi:hypothetical protein JTB14_012832 [Gonioctena quinquepunctata]|nr:hypothetical protein JTB14_012832 [Gonioctena quinquepunctata]
MTEGDKNCMNHNSRVKCSSMLRCEICNIPYNTLLQVEAQNKDFKTRPNFNKIAHWLSEVILEDFYVNNVLAGSNSLENAEHPIRVAQKRRSHIEKMVQ